MNLHELSHAPSFVLPFPVELLPERIASVSPNSLSFCGQAPIAPPPGIQLYTEQRDPLATLKNILPADVDSVRAALLSDRGFMATLRGNTEVEFDAEKLCLFLDRRVAEGTLTLSPEFMALRAAWRRDELGHALGFAYLEFLLEGTWITDRQAEALELPSNIKGFEDAGFLQDEFHILLLIAYDELCTTRAYHIDLKQNYHKWEQPAITEWLRNVAAEEAHHFENACRVIERVHPARLGEVADIVRRIRDYDSRTPEYAGLFVLDHGDRELYTPEFMDRAAATLIARLTGRRAS